MQPAPRSLPPLRDLPPPPRLPRESADLVPPPEILLESRAAITKRLYAVCWMPALVLLALWSLLVALYAYGASPTMWFLSLLTALADPSMIRYAMASLGFTPGGLARAFLLVPPIGAALGLALIPLASVLVARMNPRRFLSEQAFQRGVATRITAVLMAPAVATVALLPIAALLPVPMPWNGLSSGPLAALCLGAGALMIAWVSIRAWVAAPRVLGIEPVSSLRSTATVSRDLDARGAAARRLLAQDRRHLPPNPGTPPARRPLMPPGALTALGLIARSCLVWVAPALVVVGAAVFGVAETVVAFGGLLQSELGPMPAALSWQMLALGLPLLVCVAIGLGLSPGLAALTAGSLASQVTDQRTYAEWSHRARTNPWEARVVGVTAWIAAAVVIAGSLVLALGLALLDAHTSLSWTWIVVDVLVLAPLVGGAAASAMRRGLRDVVYGPAGEYMRREVRWALVAPDFGTRTDRARDPAVRAALRTRLRSGTAAGGAGHPGNGLPDGLQDGLTAFAGTAADEKLWVDDAEVDARDTAVREADISRGRLPDFTGGSPLPPKR